MIFLLLVIMQNLDRLETVFTDYSNRIRNSTHKTAKIINLTFLALKAEK